jgi:hypothetical protein
VARMYAWSREENVIEPLPPTMYGADAHASGGRKVHHGRMVCGRDLIKFCSLIARMTARVRAERRPMALSLLYKGFGRFGRRSEAR